jgi:ribosomal protein S27AE
VIDNSRWWLHLPPCPRCGKSHVLTDCTKRLPFEMAEATDAQD